MGSSSSKKLNSAKQPAELGSDLSPELANTSMCCALRARSSRAWLSWAVPGLLTCRKYKIINTQGSKGPSGGGGGAKGKTISRI